MSCQTIRFIGDLKTVYEDGWTTVYWCDGRISEITGEINPKKFMAEASFYYHSEPKPTDRMPKDAAALSMYLMRCYYSGTKPTKKHFEKWRVMEVLK